METEDIILTPYAKSNLIKEIAEEEGLPYQTLVTSVLHKFSTGRLVPKENKKSN